MIAADHDRRADLAALDGVVEREPGLGAIAVAEPADARRQTLERDAFAGEANPALERDVGGKQALDDLVRRRDVLRITGERDPAERALAFAEQRADVLGHETLEAERVLEPGLEREAAQVVAVVEGVGAAPL